MNIVFCSFENDLSVVIKSTWNQVTLIPFTVVNVFGLTVNDKTHFIYFHLVLYRLCSKWKHLSNVFLEGTRRCVEPFGNTFRVTTLWITCVIRPMDERDVTGGVTWRPGSIKARAVEPASASRNEASAWRDAGSVAPRCGVSFPRGTRVTYVIWDVPLQELELRRTRCPRRQTFKSLLSVLRKSTARAREKGARSG